MRPVEEAEMPEGTDEACSVIDELFPPGRMPLGGIYIPLKGADIRYGLGKATVHYANGSGTEPGVVMVLKRKEKRNA
jgi:hypothetical protein